MSKKMHKNSEPPPKRNDNPAVWDLVIEDMKARNDFGKKKYGTPLQGFNGRNALRDSYEESLDLCVYLRQKLYEEEKMALIPGQPVNRVELQEKLYDIMLKIAEKYQLPIREVISAALKATEDLNRNIFYLENPEKGAENVQRKSNSRLSKRRNRK